ncbi:MAG: U32 family peptidase, partial [Prolixibacteraceae bacterium]|nr:U32 family peptidase [Prolixibacteraceae bacterium]
NQLIDYVNELAALGIKSFKIEGRMKSGEYTYRVAKAYRMALDDFEKLPDARELLAMDFGRRKTSYFLGHDVARAISDKTVTGILLGKVERVEGEKVFFSSTMEVVQGFRLRFHQPHSGERENVKVKVVEKFGELYVVDTNGNKIIRGSKVFLSGITDIKFPSKLEEGNGKRVLPIAGGFKRKIFNDLKQIRKSKKTEIFVRVDSMEWLRKIFLNEVDGLLLSFSKITWSRFHPQAHFVQKNRHKIFVELPKFIAEDSLDFYSQLAEKMAQSGLRNFVVSHLSQKKLIPKNCRIFSNENVYVFNDAAVKMLRTQGVETFIYPQEIDFETLETLTDRSGIVPVYFYPELFYSRMPIQLESREQSLKDDMNVTYRRFRKNGVTIIVPCQPVSILQFKNRLIKNGFNRFLIDVSYDSPSKNKVRTLKSRLLRSEQVQPSVTFNFVKGLK